MKLNQYHFYIKLCIIHIFVIYVVKFTSSGMTVILFIVSVCEVQRHVTLIFLLLWITIRNKAFKVIPKYSVIVLNSTFYRGHITNDNLVIYKL